MHPFRSDSRIQFLMKRKRRQGSLTGRAARITKPLEHPENGADSPHWPCDQFRYLTLIGIALIVLCTVIIYWHTIQVPPIDYEDSFYLIHSPHVRVRTAFSGLSAVWTNPYFANFHPVTTTTWIVDRALGDKAKPFDGLPFRITQLLYAAIGASLLIPLYRRVGIPTILAAFGALVYAVHPIHTEVVAWLSARKDLMSLIFILLSFLSWLRAREATTPSQWRIRHALAIMLVLLAVLSKPIAVILPALFVAYEFCFAPHIGILDWRWTARELHPVLTRTLALAAIFIVVGGLSAIIFLRLLERDPMHGAWLIVVLLGLLFPLLAAAPTTVELAAFREGTKNGIRVLGTPFAVLSLVFGAGSAWTLWGQQQVGAIKGGLTLLPTLNLTFDAMLAYAGKALVPAYMSASYTWSEYPYFSVNGLAGAVLLAVALWIAMRLAGSSDRNHRLIAFGVFWYLIALVPVSNLVPTSTKMADRYLFVPTVGSILVLVALAALLFSASRRSQMAVCFAFVLGATGFTVWSYNRTRVWCGTTTTWKEHPQPDLSLWTAALETNPNNTFALTNLGLAYLRLAPPEAEKALEHLNRALELGQASQSKIAGNKQLVLSPVYEALGDGYITLASQLVVDKLDSQIWHQKRDAYVNAADFFRQASHAPSGFASADARVLSRLAEACEGLAQMDAQELAAAPAQDREALVRERDQLRGESEISMGRATDVLVAGNVSAVDANYRTVIIGQGNIIFGREVGATNEEKAAYYREALRRYQEAAALLPDDPRPLLYEGLCYERLTGMAQSPEAKRQQFALGEAALRKALTLNIDAPDYSLALPYRALASLYAHVNDFQSVLDSLKKAQQADPLGAESNRLDREIQVVERYLADQRKNR